MLHTVFALIYLDGFIWLQGKRYVHEDERTP